MSFLDKVHLEWWQALVLVLVLGTPPLFKAFAVILVAKCVKPDIARLALPLIFQRKSDRAALKASPTSKRSSQ